MALKETYEKQGTFLFRWRSYLPLLVTPLVIAALLDPQYTHRTFTGFAGGLWATICILTSFAGLLVRCLVAGFVPLGTSGRNTERQVATSLNTKGMYSLVRNPLYLGNFLIILGLLLFIQVWWFALVGIAIFWIFYERIIFTEEEFLRGKFGATFVDWSMKTPVFVPKLSGWEKPELPYAWKIVIRREHSTQFGMISALTLLGIAGDLFTTPDHKIGTFWWIFWGISLVVYLVFRFLKKKTRLLDIEGR
ncbi:MAG TPA: methyltransferase [Candidatus Omnitrophota bacterium]|nr:methyltransferase [Candidatus Omnitrophota bacterium]HPS36250.1 methyltransferase [Candidatus Omnitrophota bacterium]